MVYALSLSFNSFSYIRVISQSRPCYFFINLYRSETLELAQFFRPTARLLSTVAVRSAYDPRNIIFLHLGPTGLKVPIFSLGDMAALRWEDGLPMAALRKATS
ncbi:hypothetical protein V1517DRAFT_194008 [Lipomyces orientalis]|uniref:Uncharacterized protein n=1 Tax=Lipomyces orientalis TaxID=1233043 RepID=A0ACC3TJ49_9ASCO